MTAGNYAGMAAVAAMAVVLGGCAYERKFEFRKPAHYELQERSLDNVIRDHEGWRVIYTDKNGEVLDQVHSTRYQNDRCAQWNLAPHVPETGLHGLGSPNTVRVYRVQGLEQPVEKTLHYTLTAPRTRMQCKYVEIQVPQGYRLTPGVGTTGGKVPQPMAMGEVR